MIFNRLRTKNKDVTVIIPTMNSEKIISELVKKITDLFENVVVGVDSKTTDKTINVVSRYPCKVIEINNEGSSIVESMLSQFFDHCKTNWILRLDDDEMISDLFKKYLDNELHKISVDSIAFHRRWCRKINKRVEWSVNPIFGFDWQWRMFQKNKVTFNEQIHTPGIFYKSYIFAPTEAYILHFDWVYHSYEERKAKVNKYENIKSGSGHPEYYLYEDLPDGEKYFIPILD